MRDAEREGTSSTARARSAGWSPRSEAAGRARPRPWSKRSGSPGPGDVSDHVGQLHQARSQDRAAADPAAPGDLAAVEMRDQSQPARSSEVLPDPEPPARTMNSPGSIASETSARAATSRPGVSVSGPSNSSARPALRPADRSAVTGSPAHPCHPPPGHESAKQEGGAASGPRPRPGS